MRSVQTAPEYKGVEYIAIPAQQDLYLHEPVFQKPTLFRSCANGSRMGPSGKWKFHHSRDSIFQKPILQMAPYCDPVQTAPEWGPLEYRNSSTAEIQYSRSLYSRGLLTVILHKRLHHGVFWNMEIPPQQKFYFPEAYIPEGSSL